MWLLAEGTNSTPFFLILVVGVVFLVLMKMRRPAADTRDPWAKRSSTKQTAQAAGKMVGEASGEVRRWEVGMHELARDLSAQLDSKMVALQQLMRMADERIMQLEKLQNTEESRDVSPLGAESRRNVEQPVSESRRAVTAMEPAVATATAKQGARPFDDIYALADRGTRPEAIAAETDTPLGEVELILGLRRRREID
ncbi:MAG: hypothetical protein JSS27_06720 [Planctomycetes bacterium]|nr:hypothetical protein [Planctomycetota bacterium]